MGIKFGDYIILFSPFLIFLFFNFADRLDRLASRPVRQLLLSAAALSRAVRELGDDDVQRVFVAH